MKKRAILSVSNKTGIVEFGRGLAEMGFEIVSTGGTAKVLKSEGIPVTYISDVTGFPEILGGRVKTLHPKVHGGILARRTKEHLEELKENDIVPIDLVVVNLYPFKETISRSGVTLREAIENIDIGGPTMVRAAAKNYEAVGVVVNPQRYGEILDELKRDGELSLDTRFKLAVEAFSHTAEYDRYVAKFLREKISEDKSEGEGFPELFVLEGSLAQQLRYGENPHQKAAFYRQDTEGCCIAAAEKLQGKELSFNNLVDAEAALELVKEFEKTAAVIIKHTNPCGAALDNELCRAYRRAFDADPVSAFGGIVGFNRPVDEATARELVKTFLEAVVAPEFTKEALNILAEKPNLRLLAAGDLRKSCTDLYDIKKIGGGFLVQERDRGTVGKEEWQVVSSRKPNAEEINELDFAWKVVKHVKSNAIVITKDKRTLGVGAGQMNRVGAAKIALEQAGTKVKDAVVASDAFFPFRDTVDEVARKGVKAIIQPGGSIRDKETIEAADEHGIILVFTGRRHFKH